MKIALAQINPTVGDFAGNRALIEQQWQRAEEAGCDLVLFSEMSVTAYPVEDLVLRQSFRSAAMQVVRDLVVFSAERKCAAIIGGLWEAEGKPTNSLFLLEGGVLRHLQHKHALPNYGVFDEKRLFHAGDLPSVVEWRGLRIGLLLCEDLWDSAVRHHVAAQQPEIYLTIHGSPYETGKSSHRFDVASQITQLHPAPLIYVNQLGGQDDLVFDGSSFAMNAEGNKLLRLRRFAEDFQIVAYEGGKLRTEAAMPDRMSDEETLYHALMLGLRDYVCKSGFEEVIIALSGGIDSALTAAIAVDALGADKVSTYYLPSPYNGPQSEADARETAKNLGVALEVISIEPAMQVMQQALAPIFTGRVADVTEENIQSRLRGNLMMAISNKMGRLLLTTGNKSEMAVGYCTLYGDMCGAFNPLVDVYKTSVFALSRWRNAQAPRHGELTNFPVIPENVISKPPSAELRHDQKDEDSLPPYEVLDEVLEMLIENALSLDQMLAKGYEEALIKRVAELLYGAEYKRRQAAPGPKISAMAFGSDRRYPIVNAFRS